MERSGSSMQLTRAADYGIRAMVHLAGLGEGKRCLLPELARATAAPESFLSKVMQLLCRAGMAASRRGQAGGFEIRSSGRIATIRTVIEAIDGPVRLNLCLMPDDSCSRKACCPAHPIWAQAQEALMRVLESATMAELAAAQAAPDLIQTVQISLQ